MNEPNICTQIVKCLENVWNDKMFFDFCVKITDVTIECHRLILSGCSDFFRGLFRSGMREVTENCVVLQDVSCDVFQLILKTIYTGENILNSENLFEVWRAVHQLQITFMVKMCENFAIELIAMETWENIYTNASSLGSERVLNQMFTFMLNNFDQISLSLTFLQLSYTEVRNLVKNQALVVRSEDVVFGAVIKWVDHALIGGINQYVELSSDSKTTIDNTNLISETDEHQSEININAQNLNQETYNGLDSIHSVEIPNTGASSSNDVVVTRNYSRKDKLTSLLKLVRTCLVNPTVLSRALKTKLFSENIDSRNIIVDALSYHAQDFRHGQWSSAAVHRSYSEFTHGGVAAKRHGHFAFFNALDEKWFRISKSDSLQEDIQLVTFDNELYAIGKQRHQPNGLSKMFVFCDNSWEEVITMPSNNLLLVSHGQSIYILNKADNIIYNISPRKKKVNLEKFDNFPVNVDVKYATIFENSLLVFSPENQNGVDETAVHKIDIFTKVWTKLDNLDGSAEHLISFSNDKHTYILQANGSLWFIYNTSFFSKMEVKFLFKLWNYQKKLYGAITYDDQLIVLGNRPSEDTPNKKKMHTVPGYLNAIKYWETESNYSNFIPVTLPKKCLLQKV